MRTIESILANIDQLKAELDILRQSLLLIRVKRYIKKGENMLKID